jgi:hypothetical protein
MRSEGKKRLSSIKKKLGFANQKPGERPIWEVIEEIMKDVPDEVIHKLPVDGAEQHDHYIYGTPKKG